MKIIITETQEKVLINYIDRQQLNEAWSIKEINDLLEPNKKPSKKNADIPLYRDMIYRVLKNNQKSLDKIDVVEIDGHFFDKNTKKGHPLSYLNTHYKTAKLFADLFNVPKDATKQEALDIIENGLNENFEDLFVNDTENKKKIFGLLEYSLSGGDKNEKEAETYLKNKYAGDIVSINVSSGTGVSLDRQGIDLQVEFTNGEKLNYQVKPFTFYYYAPNGDIVIRGVNGRTPVYRSQDRWIFIEKNGKAIEVDAKKLKPGERQRDAMFLPSDGLVSKSEDLKPWVPKNQPQTDQETI